MKTKTAYLLGFLTACTGGMDPGDPAMPGEENPGEEDSPGGEDDLTAPQVTGSSPGDGVDSAPISAPLVVSFDERLKPQSVRDAEIMLLGFPRRGGGMFVERQAAPRYPIEVSYDDEAKEISIRPLYSMLEGTAHRIVISGVEDLSGNIIDPIEIEFSTVKAEISDEWSYDGSGDIDQHRETEFEDGLPTFVYTYIDPGEDGQWGTGDEDLLDYRRYHRTASNNQLINYGGIGEDGLWFTADDPVLSISEWHDDGATVTEGLLLAPGDDGLWFTDDDVGNSYYVNMFDERGYRSERLVFGTGADDIPETADDELIGYYRYYYEDHWLVGYMYVSDPGDDEELMTADDTGSYTALVRDELGLIVERNKYSDVSADAPMPEAADATMRTLYVYDDDHLNTAAHSFNDPGYDGEWFTFDDVQSSLVRYERTSADLLLRLISFEAGDDEAFGSGDDVIDLVVDRSFADTGCMESFIRYTDPGADDDWMTTDDNLSDYGYDYVAP